MKFKFLFKTSSLLCIYALFLMYGFPFGEGIKCWVCRSDLDPKCSDPFDNTSLPIADCDLYHLNHIPGIPATMCRKIRQKVYGQWRFIRSCAFVGVPGEGHGDENYCLMRTGSYNVFIESCTCNSKNGCNGVTAISADKCFVFLVPSVIWIFAKLLR